jgi:hypothetical protein
VIEKEVRALLPLWTMCAVAIIASRYQVQSLAYLGLAIYLIGATGLGAWSVGHEYAHGTMASMLTFPVPRRRWWMAKLAVLAPLLAALAALAASFVVLDRGDQTLGAALFWLAALAAFCIAPWVTMMTRSALAGAVFTLGLVGMSIALGDWIGVYRFGFTRDVDVFRRAFVVWTLGGLSLVGAIAGWRTFLALQETGDQGRDLQLLTRSATSASTAALHRRPPFVALVLKELRLQELAILVAAVYALGNIAVLLLGRVVPNLYSVFEVLIALYTMTMPALIGSLACAEERQFGTHESQLLLPIAAWQQWLVKSATAIALAVMVALLLPAALSQLLPAGAVHLGPGGRLVTPQTVMIVLGCVSVSLFVSTLARSGMAALLASLAAIAAVAYFDVEVGSRFGYMAFQWVHRARPAHTHHTLMIGPGVIFTVQSLLVLLIALVALALPHYRYADRRPGLVAFHAALVAAGIVAYSVAINVVMALRY